MGDVAPGDTVRITGGDDQFGRTATAIRKGDYGKWFCQVEDDDGRQYTRWLHQADLETMSDNEVDVTDRRDGYGDSVHSSPHHVYATT